MLLFTSSFSILSSYKVVLAMCCVLLVGVLSCVQIQSSLCPKMEQ